MIILEVLTGEWRRLHNKELLCFVMLTKYHSDEHIKETEMTASAGPFCTHTIVSIMTNPDEQDIFV
jgi:hypothetical protein